MALTTPLRLVVCVAVCVVFFTDALALGFSAPRIKPPAPDPTYVTRADRAALIEVADLIKRRRYSEARAQITVVSDPIARSLGYWMYFMAGDPKVDLLDADAFLDAHPDWPAINRIQSKLESRLSSKTPERVIDIMFDEREPVTGIGKIHRARALYIAGKTADADRYLRDAWINDSFSVEDERYVLSKYGGRLTREDHAARVDQLLWDIQVTNARRIMPKLSKDERRAAQIRSALLLRANNAPDLYFKLPRDVQLDPGMLHAAVRFYRRTGSETIALEMALQAPTDPDQLRNPERWREEQRLLMRWALKEGLFPQAYAVAAHHGLEPGTEYAAAEFDAGWIALRFLNDPERAETHFYALSSVVKTPISLSRGFYWLGRAAEAREDMPTATEFFHSAARHYYSYYGQLAAEALGGPALQPKFAAPTLSTAEDRALFASRPAVAALRILSDLDLTYEFMVFAYHVDGQLDTAGEYEEFAKITNGEGAPHLTVRAGKVGIQNDAFVADVAYPLVFIPDEASTYVAQEIILGLSRQESEFNPRAYSRAGARGVMQLMPATAQITARKEGMSYSQSALLDDPVYNMTIGSAHLSHLLERFDGSLVLTLAAYNAGARRADQWIETYGDPRNAGVDPVDWVELIPFSETRNYVQRVMENIQVYRGRLNNAPIPGRLAADLERGGPGARVAALDEPSSVLTARVVDAAFRPTPPIQARIEEQARTFRLALLLESVIDDEQDGDADVRERAASPPRDAAAPSTPADANALNEFSLSDPFEPTDAQGTDAISNESLTDAALAPGPGELPAPDAVRGEPALIAAEPPSALSARDAPPQPIAFEENDVDDTTSQQTTIPLTSDAPDAAPALVAGSVTTPAPSTGLEPCLTYRAFIAENAQEDASAADLNSGMLAELEAGSVC
ncbi:MAG: transglycosylase SLT domain-containing protein [Pseudomonadota bacterium]